MPELILLEATGGVAHGRVSTKVTGSDRVRYSRHERRRPAASSRGQVEHGRNSRAPLSHLHWNYESFRALPASGRTASADANAEGSSEDVCSHRPRALTRGTKIAKACPTPWDGG